MFSNTQKATAGIACLLAALAFITTASGYTWGVTGALMGAGVTCLIYGMVCLAQIKE